MLRPRSLSFQMALVAVAIAFCAIVATAFISAIVVSTSFSSYLRAELAQRAKYEAQLISDTMTQNNASFPVATSAVLFANLHDEPSGGDTGQFWVVDASLGALYPGPRSWNSPDATSIIPPLNKALSSGISSQGDFNEIAQGLLHFSARSYAAVPIVVTVNGTPTIVGALAISSEQSVGPSFLNSVNRALVISVFIIAIIVAIIGALLAQRLARPITSLTRAAAKMGKGKLSTRVVLNAQSTPMEIEQLAFTFNEMAATLQRDVNELRHQEQLQRALVANVAHELATPLTAVRGYSEALSEDDTLTAEQRANFSHIIHRETVRLGKLVFQLRQVARLESGAETMDLQPTVLRPLVSDILDMLQSEGERQAVTLRNEIAEDLPPLWIDTDRLTQVFINLVDNAVRYTPMNGVVTLTARQEGERVWVSVTDSGTGIPQEDLPRVFERFYRADASRNSDTGGTGLGLAIVKGIVEAHGGQVRAENNPDGGARMSFSLRVVPDDM
jgi:signal transduction histidine kinase